MFRTEAIDDEQYRLASEIRLIRIFAFERSRKMRDTMNFMNFTPAARRRAMPRAPGLAKARPAPRLDRRKALICPRGMAFESPSRRWTMSYRKLAVAFSLVATVSPVLAHPPERDNMTGAPAAGPAARYCLRVEPVTGTLTERIRCWTRQQWDDQGVDVDKEWAREGVRVIE
jgi:hypothetical protein